MTTDTQAHIKNLINNNRIILFMKGTASFPQCGFSYQVVNILQSYQTPFTCINVLEDENIRQGIKTYTNWPTIPQLYINGEFVGGCDIIKECHENGELKPMIAAAETTAD
jgi:monothiol glutaredoxin